MKNDTIFDAFSFKKKMVELVRSPFWRRLQSISESERRVQDLTDMLTIDMKL
jgi:hypothetical protein